ncbi:hypothetical protein [Heyndrickxia ginsengihumi]|uniref:hypothetical protein n=1 Tax=Heyndrickxia ginsengihumi TaxID=363870 RepID=UPI00046EF72E|nr:hypothetical protein [Heyndrickxia ginsengihumi]
MDRKFSTKVYQAKLKTGGKTLDQIRNDFDGYPVSDDELQNYKKAYDIIDGLEITVTESLLDNGHYVLLGWTNENIMEFREFFYLIEQDRVFGFYENDREGFIKDWVSGEYEPACAIGFDKADVEIIKELD